MSNRKREILIETLAKPEVQASLRSRPHPKGFRDRDTGQPLTLLDWAVWMLENGGDKGRRAVQQTIAQI